MPIEQVEGTVADLVNLAGLLVGERAFALHAIHCLDVVLIVERRGRAGVDHRVVEGECHPFPSEYDTPRATVLGLDVAVGAVEGSQGRMDYIQTLLIICRCRLSLLSCMSISRDC